MEIAQGCQICLQAWIKGVFLSEELANNKTGITEKTVETVLAKKYWHEKKSHCSMLEVYYKTPIFIPKDIMEDVVKSVAHKR